MLALMKGDKKRCCFNCGISLFMLTLTFYKKYSKKSGLYQPYVVYVCAMKGGLDYNEYT